MIQIFFSDSDRVGSKLIRSVTWSEYSHVGFIDPYRDTVIDSRLSAGGVTEYPAAHLYRDYPRVKVVTLEDVSFQAVQFARTQIGKGYDWTALFGLWLHRDWQAEDRWFCSELVAWACAQAGRPLLNKRTGRVVPQDLLEVLPLP